MASGRMRAGVASLVLALLLATAVGREQKHSILKCEKVHETEGGRLDMWRSEQHESLRNAHMEGAHIQLKERGLVLPKYADSALLFYCTRGSAIMGMSLPMGAHRDYRMIRKGQVVAVPRGMVFWFYNTGEKECARRQQNGREEESKREREEEERRRREEEERREREERRRREEEERREREERRRREEEERRERERREEEGEREHRRQRERDREQEVGGECHLVAMADTSEAAVNPGQCTGFSLAGERSGEWGSVLQGFSKELLAEAWEVDEQTVERLVTSQREMGIIRVDEDHPFHQRMRDSQCGRLGSSGEGSMQSMSMMHFMYDLDSANCDHYSGGGGCMTVLNRYRLPVLKTLRPDTGLGAIRTELEPEAMMAPGYMANAHTLLYCSRGSVHVQMLSPTGERSFDEELKEGQMMMIPMGHPAIKRAGREGCQLMAFTTSDMPMKMHMAGEDSVLRNMPEELLMAAFNVDEKHVSELMQRRTRYAAILPPSRQQREKRSGDGKSFPLNIDKFFKNLLKN